MPNMTSNDDTLALGDWGQVGEYLYQVTTPHTIADWASIDGLCAAYHGEGGTWLVTDRRALGRGEGKRAANTRYRYQVVSGDQSIAYGCRSERVALMLAQVASRHGIVVAVECAVIDDVDFANYYIN